MTLHPDPRNRISETARPERSAAGAKSKGLQRFDFARSADYAQRERDIRSRRRKIV
jgi:hypothetical protein